MPLAQLYITEGRTAAQKSQLIAEVTRAFVDAIGSTPGSVTVIVQDIPTTQWGSAGTPLSERA